MTSAMNAAATQDLRAVALTPVLQSLLSAAPAPSPRAARMLELLVRVAGRWLVPARPRPRRRDGRRAGPGDLGRAVPAAVGAAMPVKGSGALGTNSGPGSGFTGGGFWLIDKDLRALNGEKLQAAVQRALLRRR